MNNESIKSGSQWGGDFCLPGDIWQCLKTLLFFTAGLIQQAFQWIEAKDVAKHPTVYRTALQQGIVWLKIAEVQLMMAIFTSFGFFVLLECFHKHGRLYK